MSATILSFPDGNTIDQQEHAEAACDGHCGYEGEEIEENQHLEREHIKNILDKIDQLRHLVVEGRVDELVFVGNDPMTGYYITEVCLDPAVDRTELFGLMGVLDTVKMEIGELAAMAPVVTLAGTVLDPYAFEDDL